MLTKVYYIENTIKNRNVMRMVSQMLPITTAYDGYEFTVICRPCDLLAVERFLAPIV